MEIPCRSYGHTYKHAHLEWSSESGKEAAEEALSRGRDLSNLVHADFGLRLSATEWSEPEPHSSSIKTGWFPFSLVGDPSLYPELVTAHVGQAENRARCLSTSQRAAISPNSSQSLSFVNTDFCVWFGLEMLNK